MAGIFGSKTRQRILELFFLNSDSEFHIRDISRKIKITPIAVKKELDNLEKLYILKSANKANLRIFSVNKNSSVYNEIQGIIIKSAGFIIELKKIFEKFEFSLIYGSYAKSKLKQSSDIDVLGIGNINEDEIIGNISKLESKIGREINYIILSREELEKKKNSAFIKEIAKSEIIMLKGDEDEFKRIIR